MNYDPSLYISLVNNIIYLYKRAFRGKNNYWDVRKYPMHFTQTFVAVNKLKLLQSYKSSPMT